MGDSGLFIEIIFSIVFFVFSVKLVNSDIEASFWNHWNAALKIRLFATLAFNGKRDCDAWGNLQSC